MISSNTIITKANAFIAGTPTDLEVTQLSVIDQSLTNSKLVVQTYADLPSIVDNKGRLVFVFDLGQYFYSNGLEWTDDYTIFEGAAYGWGSNGEGRLGDNTITSTSSPVTVVGGITNWKQISAGTSHSLGVTSIGIAYAWGANDSRQLGDNTATSKRSPVTVFGGIMNWIQVSAGGSHSLGVTIAGIAYAWGSNSSGQLGDDTTSSRSSPVTVIGGITNWSQVSGGSTHSLGVTTTGIAYAWGAGGSGRLGDNTATNKSSPVTVVGGITNWSQLSAGGTHSLGVTSTGIAYAWGANSSGQLGNGTLNRSSPVTVLGGITNWSQLSAGTSHSLGVTSTGIAYAWGIGNPGQLGNNSTANRSSPVTVVGGITNWSQLSGGGLHSLGLISTGIAYAWGSNVNGQLGDDTTTNRSSPVTIIGGITNWSQVSAGGTHSLGVNLGA